jgi:hypothetical protein
VPPDPGRGRAAALGRPRRDDVALVLRSGLFDQEWVEQQLGTGFGSPRDAVRAFLDSPECSPHPLFLAEWIEPKFGKPAPGQAPLLWYLRDSRIRRWASPHPLIDVGRIRELDPALGEAPLGPVAGWLESAGPDSPLPAPPGNPTMSLRALLDASGAALRQALDDPAGRREGPVSIVMVTRDNATEIRRTVASVQAQPAEDWELLVVDAGSTDDSVAVATGLASFDPRIRLVAFEGRSLAAARNAGASEASSAAVAFLAPGDSWPPPRTGPRAAVDWAERAHDRDTAVTSLVMPARRSLRATLRWVNRTARWRGVELVVAGASLPKWQRVALTVVAEAAGHPRPVLVEADDVVTAMNRAAAGSSGEVVVLVTGDVEPDEPALHALLPAFDDADVALAQAVDVDRRGVVVSAGAVFGRSTARPEPFLAGHAVDDARGFGARGVPAALGSVVAVRATVLGELGGLDPWAGERLAATELALRAHERGLGRTELRTGAVVVSHSPALPADADLAATLDAIDAHHPSPPPGSDEAWQTAGFEVVGRTMVVVGDPHPGPLDTPMLRPRTVVRPLRASVHEAAPSLRWTIDLPSPAGRKGEAWGDTHFGQALARALRRLGQHVCVDPREARHRETRSYDDVVLVLRGLDPVAPRPDCLNAEWVISHPDLVSRGEVAGFDLVYAASESWSATKSAEWGVDVRPLLQATDPDLFNPERAEPDSGVDVLFVGNSRGVQRPALRAALAVGVPVVVHGQGWSELLPDGTVSSKGIDNAELGAAYAAAAVVLNDHWEDMRRDGFVSNRLMDAAATGTRVVSDRVPGVDLTAMFHGLVQTFDDEADLARILATRDERFPAAGGRAVAARRVAEEHSFDARAEVLLADVVARLPR